ncbi:hypothetical protein SRIMM317S_00824 [Streptomyces rimosus subsp. rimosus]
MDENVLFMDLTQAGEGAARRAWTHCATRTRSTGSCCARLP